MTTFDPSKIDPKATYVLCSNTDGEPVRELDLATGEVTEFARGSDVHLQEKLTGQQLLDRHAAAERTRATGKPQAVRQYVNDTDYAMGEHGEMVEIDDLTEGED